MKCKKCNSDNKYILSRYVVKPNQEFFSNGQSIPTNYKGFSYIPYCEKCGEPYEDYIDLPVHEFLNLLDDNNYTNRMAKGKALIRYFELDKLLELKKEEGD